MRPDGFYVGAGAAFSCAWFAFFDGLTIASRDGLPYEFQMWLPGILCLMATVVFMFADPKDIQGEEDFMGGMTDETKQNRAKIIFFMASVLCLAGLSVAIWKLSDTYPNAGTSWPGVALLLQSLLMLIMNGLILAGRAQSNDDGVFM